MTANSRFTQRTPTRQNIPVSSHRRRPCKLERCTLVLCCTLVTERIEYKLLSLTYKVLTTTQPSYLHNLITVQPPRSTRSSSLVTLARPSTSSSLRITNRSFQYASPRLWNQLPASLRQPRTNLSTFASVSSFSGTSSTSSINSLLSSSITPSLFHSRLKTFLFCKPFPP